MNVNRSLRDVIRITRGKLMRNYTRYVSIVVIFVVFEAKCRLNILGGERKTRFMGISSRLVRNH